MDIGVLTVVVGLLCLLALRRVVLVMRSSGPSRRPTVVVLVLALLALTAASIPELRHHWVQSRAGDVVEQISGVPGSTARCQRFTADLFDVSVQSGFVAYGGHVAQLRRTVCNELAGWLMSGKDDPTPAQVRAVHVVVHEAMHVAGEFDESVAECTAMQLDARAAELWGATPEQAHALALAYYQESYPLMREEYVSTACVADGAGDLSPGDGRFP